jgi:hypothetical protein
LSKAPEPHVSIWISVDDFFGAAGVIAQVVKALRKHGGAQDNYQAICFEVEAFGELMEKV